MLQVDVEYNQQSFAARPGDAGRGIPTNGYRKAGLSSGMIWAGGLDLGRAPQLWGLYPSPATRKDL